MTKIVVVGGGILGMLSARELVQSGCEVVLYERGKMGQESSWAGGGILSPLYPWRYPDAVTELARWSQEHYQGLAEQLVAETGVDPEWTQSGLLMVGIDDPERQTAVDWAERFGYRLECLTAESVTKLSPQISKPAGTSLWMPEVAQLRNPRLVKAVKQSLIRLGVTIYEDTPVTAIETGGGKVTGVKAERGVTAAEKVVVCGGAWSGQVLAGVGVDLAVSPVRGQMLLFKTEPGMLSQVVLSEGYYLIPRRDGRILVGSTLEHVGFDKGTTESARDELSLQATRIMPALKGRVPERQWAGLRPGTRDGIPYISGVPGYEGLYINAGQYRNGVVTGMASARLLRNLVLGEEPILPAQPYRL